MEDYGGLLTPSPRDHPMDGFDERYADPVSYILDITYDIWEGKDLELIRETYAPKVRVQSPHGVIDNVDEVIEATVATLAEFPDRENLGEDVIWSDDPDGGFLSSHRILSTATHLGHGQFGVPTGSRYTYRVMADCAVRDNMIYDEWLIRDFGAIVRQAGLDPAQFAQSLVDEGRNPVPWQDDSGSAGGSIYRGVGNDHPAGAAYRRAVEALARGDASSVVSDYDRAAQIELPGGDTAHGPGGLVGYWGAVRQCFSDAELEIHHCIGRFDVGLRPRAALRWTLRGTHDGAGMFGEPTGVSVFMQGLSHAEFSPRGIVAEWLLIDEIAVWQQVLAGRGA